MSFACVRFFLLLVIFAAAIRCEDTQITFYFQSHHDELGDDVQYEVEVFSSNENECNYHDHLAEEVLFNVSSDVATHSMMITKPHITNLYCVRITPMKRNRERCQLCQKYAHEQIISLSRVPRSTICHDSCKHWNLNYTLTPFPSKNYLEMNIESMKLTSCLFTTPNLTFSLTKSNLTHFKFNIFYALTKHTKFKAKLYSLPEWNECFDLNYCDCNVMQRHPESALVNQTVFYSSNYNASLVFVGLKPGNYCITINPRHQCCDIADRCQGRHTKIVYLSEDDMVQPLPRTVALVETSWLTVTLTVATVSLCLMCAAVIVIRFRRAQNPPMNQANIVVSPPELEYCDKPKKQPKVIKVLCPIEAKEIQDCVKALVDFLCVNYQLNVKVDFLDTAMVFVNPVAWYSQGDVFLVVETEGAAFREQCLIQKKAVYHKDEDALDPYFMHAYNRYITDPNSLFNYAKFVVVHFSFTPHDVKFTNLAMDKRYFIIQQLQRLCYFLTYGEELKFSKEGYDKFNSDFRANEQFLALNNAIDRAKEFVRQYPDYVRDKLIFE